MGHRPDFRDFSKIVAYRSIPLEAPFRQLIADKISPNLGKYHRRGLGAEDARKLHGESGILSLD